MKKTVIPIILVLSIFLNSIFTTHSYAFTSFSTALNDIQVIYETDDKIIFVSDNIFDLKSSLSQKNILNLPNPVPLYLPEGKILSQQYLSIDDIQEKVDSLKGTGTFTDLLSNPITDALIFQICKIISKSGVIGAIATFITWSSSHLLSKSTNWWTESLVQILRGEISYVRATIIENPRGDYPKVFYILERIK